MTNAAVAERVSDSSRTVGTKQYMEDGQGRLVPMDKVKEVDLLRDGLVKDLVARAREIQEVMAGFKSAAMEEVDAFTSLSAKEYDVEWGGKKGNMSLFSYDMRYKVQIQMGEYQAFDERLHVAKGLIDECLVAWAEGGRSEIRLIINDAFNVDKEGRVNIRRIQELRKHKIDDPKWIKAMEMIADSLHVVNRKAYIRMYERTQHGGWKNICLDFAAL
jgi:hypothetical protein